MKEKIIYLDIDGVLADFSTHFLNYLNIEDKTPPSNWHDKRFSKNFHKIVNDELFWLTIPRLINPNEIDFKFMGYCTNRTNISKEITEKWLSINGFPNLPVYCTDNKLKTLKELSCDLFLDDSIENFISLNEGGIKTYLFTHSHNMSFNVNYRVNTIEEFKIFTKTNILIIGHKEHGKTTFSELLSKYTGYKYVDSSLFACKVFVFDKLKDIYNYKTIDDCYSDRRNKRDVWFNLINDYNRIEKTKLVEDILKSHQIYVGLRSSDQIQNAIKRGLFDLIIGVYNDRLEHENKNSLDYDIFKYSDIIIYNNGDLIDLENKTKKISNFL
jgi:hypothetical protein